MKKILYLILISSLICSYSCLKEDEDLFDKSPAERMDEAIANCNNILNSAPNGWVMQYYAGDNPMVGGYTYICSFKDGKVTVSSELEIEDFKVGDEVESLYKISPEQSIVLSFDTYNKLLHYFATPSQGAPNGMKSDYEFIVKEVTASKIVLAGKKRGKTIVMTPFPANADKKAYLEKINKMSADAVSSGMKLFIDGQEYAITNSNRNYTITYTEKDVTKKISIAYIYTETGIQLYEPITIAGKTMQNFRYDDPDKLVCTDSGVDAYIKFEIVPLNNIIANTDTQWFFEYSTVSPSVESMLQAANTAMVDEYGLEFIFGYLGNSPFEDYPGRIVGFYISDGTNAFNGLYIFEYKTVNGTDNKVEVKYKSDSLNGSDFRIGFGPVVDAVNDKSPYILTADNVKNPQKITFTSEADPAFYFTVEL